MVRKMLEAVNSVLSNAPLTKAVVQQQSVATSFSANPARIQEASLQAPYISLYIKVDTNFDRAILQIRDSDTGDVVRQIPTESQLEAYRRAQTSNAVRPATPEEDAVAVEAPDLFTAQTTAADTAPQPETQTSSATAPTAPQTGSVNTQA